MGNAEVLFVLSLQRIKDSILEIILHGTHQITWAISGAEPSSTSTSTDSLDAATTPSVA